jgi:hypothetical protein
VTHPPDQPAVRLVGSREGRGFPAGVGLEPRIDFDPELSAKARRLHRIFEPIGAVYIFSPECHAAFEQLGFPRAVSDGEPDTLVMQDLAAYYCSRGGDGVQPN